jgi:hypothetical protein
VRDYGGVGGGDAAVDPFVVSGGRGRGACASAWVARGCPSVDGVGVAADVGDVMHHQVAARLAGALSLWRKFELQRRNLMKAQLERIRDLDGLSRDTHEIVTQSLQPV